MLLSAVSVLVVAQSSSEIPEGLTSNPVYVTQHFLQIKTIKFNDVFNLWCKIFL